MCLVAELSLSVGRGCCSLPKTVQVPVYTRAMIPISSLQKKSRNASPHLRCYQGPYFSPPPQHLCFCFCLHLCFCLQTLPWYLICNTHAINNKLEMLSGNQAYSLNFVAYHCLDDMVMGTSKLSKQTLRWLPYIREIIFSKRATRIA